MAANWLRSTLVVVLVVGMGQGFFLCRRGGGGVAGRDKYEGKIKISLRLPL